MSTEKIDLHYHQQLSALLDGELAPDQARFLLRRLQHDDELAGCVARWQVLGDVLRGDAIAPAPEGFSARVAAAVAAEAPGAGLTRKAGYGRRAVWGGGAIAASMAAVAFFIAVPQVPDEAEVARSPVVATQPAVSEPVFPGRATAPEAGRPAPAMTAATASAPPGERLPRRSATRTRQAARPASVARQAPERAVATAPLPRIHSIEVAPPGTGVGNPFANVRLDPPAARPWPRTMLPQYSSDAFSAAYPLDRAAPEFYPFDPKLPAASLLTPPVPESGDDR